MNTIFLTRVLLMLQLFAEAGTVVNTTYGDVNAYTGDSNKTGSMDPTIKAYYDTELLENARVEMYFAQFAKRQNLPRGRGKTVEWRRPKTFARATVLQEGVIPTGQKFGFIATVGHIQQYGTYSAYTDELELHAYDDAVLTMTEEMGGSMAETQEVLIRDALLANTNVMFCDNITLATGAVDSKPNCCNGSEAGDVPMQATDTVMSVLTDKMVNKAVTFLKKCRVPKINGKYYAMIHPSVAEDLRNSEGWLEAHKYAHPEEIYYGEIGELHGCRFIENPFAPILDGEDYKNAQGTVTYATYFFGRDAFGIIDPEGGAARMIIKSKEEVGGPLEQFGTVGYKFETNGATMLYPERMLRVMSCSTYSDIDEAN